MVIPFQTLKVIQACAVLLRAHEGQMSRLRLLKLLYIADRECLAESLRPITGDRPVAMNHGPVLSRTYNLIKSQDIDSPLWDRFIQPHGPQDLRLIENPGVGKLSQFEIDKLQSTSERHRSMNDYDIALETHEFAEWKRNQPDRPRSSKPIPLADLFSELGLADHAAELEASAAKEAELDELLGGAVTG
jgi:uncharacterized phage-associated protein